MPIIRDLLGNGNTVILGVTSLTKDVLTEEFPQLKTIDLPEYKIRYSSWLPLWLKLTIDLPRLWSRKRKEHELVKTLVKKYQINILISDNRYGVYCKDVRSIIICHQLNIKAPAFRNLINKVHVTWLKCFDEVWVPDHEEPSKSLAGELSKNIFGLNCRYIGPLSRLNEDNSGESVDNLFILSGPEPAQYELFRKSLEVCNQMSGKKNVIIASSKYPVTGNVNAQILFQPKAKVLQKVMTGAKRIICRSGYSTLMDLHQLGKKELVLIPTPGQTEQEYLASYWKEKVNAVILNEDQIDKYTF